MKTNPLKLRLLLGGVALLLLDQVLHSPRASHNTHHIREKFQIYKEPTQKKLASFIRKHGRSHQDSHRLARSLKTIAGCFEIDAVLLTSLVTNESGWKKKAKSPTWAMGLTQFTSAGIREASGQLRGDLWTRPETTRYLNNVINECVEPKLGIEWVQLWKRARTIKEQKLLFLEDENLALVYGAVLLKTYVSIERFKNRYQSLHYVITKGVSRYNGDNRKVKRRQRYVRVRDIYQQKVMSLAKSFAAR